MEKICIDATVILGLNSGNETGRKVSKNFLIEHIKSDIFISYEQIAIIDKTIWNYSHDLQSAYYPFLDHIMTELRFIRRPYSEQTLNLLEQGKNLDLTERLTCAFSREHACKLFTWNPLITNYYPMYAVKLADAGQNNELCFSPLIEKLYQQSLGLRISSDSSWQI